MNAAQWAKWTTACEKIEAEFDRPVTDTEMLEEAADLLLWLLAGGVAYTAGVAFYAAEKMRYAHLVWHLCVITGAACHVIAVLMYEA